MLQQKTIGSVQDDKAGGDATDLLSLIYKIEIRNEEKISDSDRLFCEEQQESLYRSLREIDRWYGLFVEEASKYRESHQVSYTANGKIKRHDPFRGFSYVKADYTVYEFKPFESIDKLAEKNHKAVDAFAKSIVSYFNNTYNVSVPYPEIDSETLPMGFRPVYQSYVDTVIEHLGGKSFRHTAEDELLKRFHAVVRPGRWSKVKPELKKDKIVFPDIISFDDFWPDRNKIHYNYRKIIEEFCAGIAFGADDTLRGSISLITGFDDDNIDISRPYSLATALEADMKFFKNGRIDVRFKDALTAEACYRKLRLDTIQLESDEK